MSCSVTFSNRTQTKNTVDIGKLWKNNILVYNLKNRTDYQLRLVKNKARGNCLFIALEQAFPIYNRISLRRQAVDHILNKPQLVNRLLQQNINDYNIDLRDDTCLLNGIGWPEGGPSSILELLQTENQLLHEKAFRLLRPILLRATYYADNEIIEAVEKVLNIGIILLSDNTGEIAWHSISTRYDKYVIIYNYDDSHYELVEIKENNNSEYTSEYKRNWEQFKRVPRIIRDFIPTPLIAENNKDTIDNISYVDNMNNQRNLDNDISIPNII